MINELRKGSPVLQAALIHQATGITINPEDIKFKTPEELIELEIAREAMKDLSKDEEFMREAKYGLIDKIYGKR